MPKHGGLGDVLPDRQFVQKPASPASVRFSVIVRFAVISSSVVAYSI